jgi:hypothetical protein
VQYPGETAASFGARHRTHVKALRCGQYTIDRAVSYAAGRREPIYDGYLYSTKRRAVQEPIFRARREEFLAELARLLDVVQIFLAPLQAEQRLRRRVETAIVRCLRAAGGEVAAFLDKDLATWDRGADEAAVRVASHSEQVFRGLPTEFEA